MSIAISDLIDEIIRIMMGNGQTVTLYDESENKVYDSSKATRIYTNPSNYLLSINDSGENTTVILYIGGIVSIAGIETMLDTLRMTCSKYHVLFNLRKYGQEVNSKNVIDQMKYLFENDDTLIEGVYYGSSKSSYIDYSDGTRLVIRHKRPIDSTKNGSRARQIKMMYIDKNNGERLLFPYNNLIGAKAMSRHISDGGQMSDDIGKTIIDMLEIILACKSIIKSVPNDSQLTSIKNHLHITECSIKSKLKNYSSRRNNKDILTPIDVALNENEEILVERLCQSLIKHGIDKKITRLAYRGLKEYGKSPTENIDMRFRLDSDDGIKFNPSDFINNTKNMYKDQADRVIALLDELAQRVVDEDISLKLADKVFSLSNGAKADLDNLESQLTKIFMNSSNYIEKSDDEIENLLEYGHAGENLKKWFEQYNPEAIIKSPEDYIGMDNNYAVIAITDLGDSVDSRTYLIKNDVDKKTAKNISDDLTVNPANFIDLEEDELLLGCHIILNNDIPDNVIDISSRLNETADDEVEIDIENLPLLDGEKIMPSDQSTDFNREVTLDDDNDTEYSGPYNVNDELKRIKELATYNR